MFVQQCQGCPGLRTARVVIDGDWHAEYSKFLDTGKREC